MCKLLILLALAVPAVGQRSAAEREAWNRPVKPFRIAGNLYYVGMEGVSAFLIHSPTGSLLVDGGFEESAPQVQKNIRELGFEITSVKFLLATHAHHDHAGGLPSLKQRSGAKLAAGGADRETFESGKRFPAIKVDVPVTDGDTITAGTAVATAHATPGHTPGCTTWTTVIREGGRDYTAAISCSTSVVVDKLTPEHAAVYVSSFRKMRAMKVDIYLSAHPFFFKMEEKRERLSGGGANPFVDPGEWGRYLDESEAEFRKVLAR